MSINDEWVRYLHSEGYSGNINDMMRAALQAEVASGSNNLNDLWVGYLRAEGYTGSINDMMYQWLGSKGYTGSLNDRLLSALKADDVFGAAWSPLSPPAELGWTPPFTVYQSGDNFKTDINMDDYIVPSDVTYFLSPDGDDSNDGLSAESPKKSIANLVDALNASPPSVGATLYLAPGWYINGDSMNGRSLTFPCNLICETGRAVLALTQTVTGWTSSLGAWLSSTLSAGSVSCVDFTEIDSFGIPRKLYRTDSVAITRALPGSMYTGATSIAVRTFDSREPDADVVVFANSDHVWNQTDAVDTYCRGISFYGGERPYRLAAGGATTSAFLDCSFRYGALDQRNGVEVTADATSDTLLFFVGCDASYNPYDGFGYRGSARVVEIDCRGVWNGRQAFGSANNGSTAHNTVVSIRVNGTYRYNNDRNVHDIDSAKSWLVGCQAGDAQNGISDVYDNANFVFGRPLQTDATLAWLTGCQSLGGSAGDLGAYSNAVVTVDGGSGFDVVTEGDSGQVIFV